MGLKELLGSLVVTVVVGIAVVSVFALRGEGPAPGSTVDASAGAGGPAPQPTAALDLSEAAQLGREVATQMGCTGCHTVNGNPSIGPTWAGLFGKQESLEGGATVNVDEAYLRESILDPNAKIVAGFQPNLMPNFGESLSDEQVSALIAYIQELP